MCSRIPSVCMRAWRRPSANIRISGCGSTGAGKPGRRASRRFTEVPRSTGLVGLLQGGYRRGQGRTKRTGERFIRSVVIILNELPHQVRAFFGVQSEHAEFDKLISGHFACPDGADDLALVVLLEIDLPSGLELEIVDADAGRELAFDPDARYLLLVRHAHGVLFPRAVSGLGGSNSDVAESRGSREQQHSGGP